MEEKISHGGPFRSQKAKSSWKYRTGEKGMFKFLARAGGLTLLAGRSLFGGEIKWMPMEAAIDQV